MNEDAKQLIQAKAKLKLQAIGDSQESSSSSTYEGVSADDFAEYKDEVIAHLDGLTAASIVLVFSVFMCAGIMAVSTLIRSLERF